jgi:hypothetical protein
MIVLWLKVKIYTPVAKLEKRAHSFRARFCFA